MATAWSSRKTPLDLKRLREGGYGEMLRMIREEEPPRPSLKISTLGDEATSIAQHRHTGRPLLNVVTDANITGGVRYSRDGTSLIVVTHERNNSAVLFYDADTGEYQRSIPLTEVSDVYITDGRNNLFGADVRSEFVLWDLSTGAERLRLPGYSGVHVYAISPDGSRIVLGDSPRTGESELTFWCSKTSRPLLTVKCQGTVRSITFSPDGNRLIGAFSRSSNPAAKLIQIWDATPLPEENAQ